MKSKAKQTFAEAWDKASEAQRKNLRQGLEDKITEKGEIKDATDFELIQHICLIEQEYNRELEDEDYQDDFEGIEIEYSVSSFVEGY